MDVGVAPLTVRLPIIYCDWKRNAAWQKAENLEEAAQCPLAQMSKCKLNLVKIGRAFWNNTQKAVAYATYHTERDASRKKFGLCWNIPFLQINLTIVEKLVLFIFLAFFLPSASYIAMSISIRFMDIYVCYLFSTVIHTVFPKGSLRFEPGDLVWCVGIPGNLSPEY